MTPDALFQQYVNAVFAQHAASCLNYSASVRVETPRDLYQRQYVVIQGSDGTIFVRRQGQRHFSAGQDDLPLLATFNALSGFNVVGRYREDLHRLDMHLVDVRSMEHPILASNDAVVAYGISNYHLTQSTVGTLSHFKLEPTKRFEDTTTLWLTDAFFDGRGNLSGVVVGGHHAAHGSFMYGYAFGTPVLESMTFEETSPTVDTGDLSTIKVSVEFGNFASLNPCRP